MERWFIVGELDTDLREGEGNFGDAGEVEEEEEAEGWSGCILSFGLLGPRTLPSFAYSQVRFLRMQRLHEGCSPLH